MCHGIRVIEEMPRAQIWGGDIGEGEEFIDAHVAPVHRPRYTLGQMYRDLDWELERREREYYEEMSVEFDDLINNYFCDEVPSWIVWREGWRNFVDEYEGILSDYFEEEWDEECWNW